MTAPPWPVPPPVGPPRWLTTFLVVGVLLGAALAAGAMTAALTRHGTAPGPNHTAAEHAAAQSQLCSNYKLAAQAQSIETNIPGNTALSRISLTNGAMILRAAAANPALEPEYREAAQNLAVTYETLVAVSTAKAADDPQMRSTADDVNAKDSVLKTLCGN